VEQQEVYRNEGGWPQLRGALEASLLVPAEGERARHVAAAHAALEQEIALMQV
jgi:hypothetical protein